ncbi:esterase-like activity of phytase family protein [Polycladidibacter hongkongensis]|uniref:esterase-like activity of phytase family protein n=1 Tax=Polycladidibacter hongkongensis TaxID=1647556 RepID=UPI00082AFFDF|nr:esterase-like activity of phytase family protein [Pseudovibrio hongkongensis]
MNILRSRLAQGVAIATATTLLASTHAAAQPHFFERIATFPVYKTLPANADKATETVAEIISATQDGRTLVFTDSPADSIVFVNATNPAKLKPMARVDVGGEPTSVTVASNYALAGVNTSKSFVEPSGYVAVIDLDSKAVAAKCDVGGQPDAVAISPDGQFLAVAIENERDEDLNDGVIPQAPAGHLSVFQLDSDGKPVNCDSATTVPMTGLAEIAPSDPEPEFVAINDDNIAVVTLQENNHIALVDLATSKVIKHFSAGTASLAAVPAKKARMSDASGDLKDVRREPDAVAWIDNERFVTANEGDYKGGSRGFTIWNKDGSVSYDSGALMEHLGMSHGHYPSKRAHKKGTEPEGVATGSFDGEKLIFVNSERGNFVAVFKDTGAAPQFRQFLPTHIAPEGLLALPKRGLFVVANEKDEAEEGVRAHVGVYRFGAAASAYPQLISEIDPATEAPIGWGAISGMVGDSLDANKIYAVSDSFYDAARIFQIDVSANPARITSKVDLSGGAQKRYDLEGIALAADGGFWLSSEGHPKKGLKHLLIKTSAQGVVQEEIELPASLVEQAQRFSLEGVTTANINGAPQVIVAFQREWKDDTKGQTKLGFYNPATKEWTFALYPLYAPASPAGGWVGLSEVTSLGDSRLAIIERDNKGGEDAAIKQVTVVDLAGIMPKPHGATLPVLEKVLALDLLPTMAAGNGWTPDKVEGLAITADGRVLVSTDNDGVDDANGESLFFDIGTRSSLDVN